MVQKLQITFKLLKLLVSFIIKELFFYKILVYKIKFVKNVKIYI